MLEAWQIKSINQLKRRWIFSYLSLIYKLTALDPSLSSNMSRQIQAYIFAGTNTHPQRLYNLILNLLLQGRLMIMHIRKSVRLRV